MNIMNIMNLNCGGGNMHFIVELLRHHGDKPKPDASIKLRKRFQNKLIT
jgi:hypothetical protein